MGKHTDATAEKRQTCIAAHVHQASTKLTENPCGSTNGSAMSQVSFIKMQSSDISRLEENSPGADPLATHSVGDLSSSIARATIGISAFSLKGTSNTGTRGLAAAKIGLEQLLLVPGESHPEYQPTNCALPVSKDDTTEGAKSSVSLTRSLFGLKNADLCPSPDTPSPKDSHCLGLPVQSAPESNTQASWNAPCCPLYLSPRLLMHSDNEIMRRGRRDWKRARKTRRTPAAPKSSSSPSSPIPINADVYEFPQLSEEDIGYGTSILQSLDPAGIDETSSIGGQYETFENSGGWAIDSSEELSMGHDDLSRQIFRDLDSIFGSNASTRAVYLSACISVQK